MRVEGSWPFKMSLFGKILAIFQWFLKFNFLKCNWFMKSKILASRQDLLQTDENLRDKGSLEQVP